VGRGVEKVDSGRAILANVRKGGHYPGLAAVQQLTSKETIGRTILDATRDGKDRASKPSGGPKDKLRVSRGTKGGFSAPLPGLKRSASAMRSWKGLIGSCG